MKKIFLLTLTLLLLVTSAVSAAPAWQQTGDNAAQTNSIDTSSIRYYKGDTGINQNIIIFQEKSQYKKAVLSKYQPGGQMVAACSMDIKQKVQLTYSYSYSDPNTSMSGMDSTGGTPVSIDKDSLAKADYDFLIKYCKENDAAITKATLADKNSAISLPSVDNKSTQTPADSGLTGEEMI
jgi:hypothetical protein